MISGAGPIPSPAMSCHSDNLSSQQMDMFAGFMSSFHALIVFVSSGDSMAAGSRALCCGKQHECATHAAAAEGEAGRTDRAAHAKHLASGMSTGCMM